MIYDDKMYTFDARIRFSECDKDRILTYESLIDYFQDCSMFHAEDVGFGFDYMKPINTAWIVNSWQIVFNELPVFKEKVTVGTIAHSIKGFLGQRNYFMQNESKVFAYANSVWSYMDMNRMVPVKVSQEMKDAYGIGSAIEMDYAGRKIAIPDISPENVMPEIIIGEENLDTNGHVNNAQYIRMALKALKKGLGIKQLRVEYNKQAYLGDIIIPNIYSLDDDRKIVCLISPENEKYCAVEITGGF